MGVVWECRDGDGLWERMRKRESERMQRSEREMKREGTEHRVVVFFGGIFGSYLAGLIESNGGRS